MKYITYILLVFVILVSPIFSQTADINGIVKDSKTLLPLSYCSVSFQGTMFKTSSNTRGEFLFKKVPSGKYLITISHLGYKKYNRIIRVKDLNPINLEILLKSTPIELGEAIVISTRSKNILREISLPIEIVNSKKIEESVELTTSDLLSEEPGIDLISDGSWAKTVSIRGLSKQNIVYLVDGDRIETSTNLAAGLSLIDLNDVSRMEIIKGGLSSLFGTGATGGVVNIITSQANNLERFSFKGSLLSSYTGVNRGASSSINLSAGNNNWYAKITGSVRNASDTKTPNGILPNSSFRDYGISSLLGFSPSENIGVKFNYQKFKASDVGIPGGSPFPQNASARYLEASRELFSASVSIKRISKLFSNLQLKYYHQLIKRDVEIKPNSTVIVNPKADHITNGFLAQSEWIAGGRHYLIGGIDLWKRSYEGGRSKNIKPQNKIIFDKPVPNSSFGNVGLFLQDEFHAVKNKLKLTFGGRYDLIFIKSEKTDNPNYILVNGNKIIPPSNPQSSFSAGNEMNRSFSGNFGVLYSLTKSIDLAVSSAYSFRSPSLEERFQFIDLGGKIFLGNPKLKPEENLSFNLGLRIWKEKLSLNINTFINYFNNLVIDNIEILDSLFIKQNVGKARLYGFDSKIEYNFLEDYLLSFTLAYVNGLDTRTNEYLPQIPPFNSTIELTLPIKNYFNLHLSSSLYADQNKIATNETRTPGYTYYNISVNSYSVNLGNFNFRITAGIKNMFNKSYKSHLSTYRGRNLTEPGRNFYAKIKFYW